jgi:hypothetical protein
MALVQWCNGFVFFSRRLSKLSRLSTNRPLVEILFKRDTIL